MKQQRDRNVFVTGESQEVSMENHARGKRLPEPSDYGERVVRTDWRYAESWGSQQKIIEIVSGVLFTRPGCRYLWPHHAAWSANVTLFYD